ncbi:MAG: aryl-sulfate sulfotransferase [Dehalococcoidales bacterium]|nr:aryl-sulfate sulfotransferase [Dehalococcoidales bacterium]
MAVSVFPTGTTIYDPNKCWNGYTIIQCMFFGAALIDMNGNLVRHWKHLQGLPSANKIFPGGYIMGATAQRNPKFGFQDNLDLVQLDWEDNVVWKFDHYDFVKNSQRKKMWMARQHHDYQRDGNPVGYYVPGMEPNVSGGNTLIVCHKNLKNPEISEKLLVDDAVIEVTWDGEIVWEWNCNEHFKEFGFSEEARNTMYRNPNVMPAGGGMGDWMHLNCISKIGPNKWYEEGNETFNPENLVFSGRQTNILAIIEKSTGNIIWQVGPDYTKTEALRNLKQIIGPHHVHMIPEGLPGAGNMLVYDNGGTAGYGAPNPGSVTGVSNALRDYSRVIEFDPVTLEIIWQYPDMRGPGGPMMGGRLYSSFMCSAQRLVNGNTLITEGATGRLIEVNKEGKIVWEFVSPWKNRTGNVCGMYRAYRVPYEWIPQLEKPEEVALPEVDNSRFRIPKGSRSK